MQDSTGLQVNFKDHPEPTRISGLGWAALWVQGLTGQQTEFNVKLNSTVSFRQSGVSHSVQGWRGSQKDLKTKLGCTVSTRLVLGTLGYPFSDLAMQKSYGIMLRHQSQNKTPTSRNPFHYCYPSESGTPKLWQVNYLDSPKCLLHRCPFFYDFKPESCSSAFSKL
jgi:hypothetical protein